MITRSISLRLAEHVLLPIGCTIHAAHCLWRPQSSSGVVRFEGQPGPVPIPPWVLLGYVILLLLAAIATTVGALRFELGSFGASPFGAAVGAVFALELIRRARWAARTWVVLPDRAELRVRPLGLLPLVPAAWIELRRARLSADARGPCLVDDDGKRLAFSGLDPADWGALALAVGDGGGLVDPEFAPPPLAVRSGVSPGLAAALLLVCASSAVALEWNARLEPAAKPSPPPPVVRTAPLPPGMYGCACGRHQPNPIGPE